MTENYFPIEMIRDLLPGQAVVQTLAIIWCGAAEYCSFGNESREAITCEASGDGVAAHETQVANDEDSRINTVLLNQWKRILSQTHQIGSDMIQHQPKDLRKEDPKNGFPKLKCRSHLQIRNKVTNVWYYGVTNLK